MLRGHLVIDEADLTKLNSSFKKNDNVHENLSKIGSYTRPVKAPSLTLFLSRHGITGHSPSNVLSWNAKLFKWPDLQHEGTSELQIEAINMVIDHVASLYESPEKYPDLDLEFGIIGGHIRRLIPAELADVLESPAVTHLQIMVPPTFDFPLELCEMNNGRLAQDRLAVSRWYTGGSMFRHNHEHAISDIALVLGKMKQDPSVEVMALASTGLAEFRTFEKYDELKQMFRSGEFNVMHYFGHSGEIVQPGAQRGRYLNLEVETTTFA